jgi:hypothetical protein
MSGGGPGGSGSLGGRGAAAAASGHSATLASHGAALADHGATRASTLHAANSAAGKHAELDHATSKLAGDDHHHHPLRREPQYWDSWPQFLGLCSPERLQNSPICDGPTKSLPGSKGRS